MASKSGRIQNEKTYLFCLSLTLLREPLHYSCTNNNYFGLSVQTYSISNFRFKNNTCRICICTVYVFVFTIFDEKSKTSLQRWSSQCFVLKYIQTQKVDRFVMATKHMKYSRVDFFTKDYFCILLIKSALLNS
jgi:hypothetical protein